MMGRYQKLIFSLVLPLLVLGGSFSFSENKKGLPADDPFTRRVNQSVERGLAYLAKTQNANGSWTCRVGYKLNNNYEGTEKFDNVCITSLAGLAFMANGNLPGRGKYGKNVSRALDFVLSCCRESDGYITKHGTRMYEHAFATLFLAEIYGMSPRADIKQKLKKAADLIVRSQNAEGGWRYQPAPIDADISVTVTPLQALRAVRNAGISVPKKTIDRAINYIKKCSRPNGSFSYQLRSFTRQSPALTAAGVTALMSAGDYDAPEVIRGLKFLALHKAEPPALPNKTFNYHFLYSHYYCSQAMYQAGGRYWNNYYRDVYGQLLARQFDDGYWSDDVGRPYATAMACIIMQIPNEYLPILQR